MNAKLLQDTISSAGASQFERLKEVTCSVLGEIYNNGLTPTSVRNIVDASEEIIEMVQKNATLLDELRSFTSYEPIALIHPFLSAIISVLICQKLDWESERTLKAACLGALLQDVGLRELPLEIMTTAPGEMTKEQFSLYKTHTQLGFDMVSKHTLIPAAVGQIIYQHHEFAGKGFPKELPSVKIYPLAKVVCISERFVRFIYENKLNPVEGLKAFMGQKFELLHHDPELSRALIKSFIKVNKKEGV